jgi:uncharacterized membrane protein YczE
MRAPPRLRGGLVTRLVLLVFGLAQFAAGIVAFLESELGLPPWDVLHQGIAERTPLSFGEANIAVGVTVLAFAWLLGARVGIGTVANATLIGLFVIGLTSLQEVQRLSEHPLSVRVALLAAGILLVGAGSGFYLGAALGAGPRDSLMVVVAERASIRIAVVRGGLELSALAAGLALGGTAGVGTLAFALLVGPAVEGSFWALRRSGLAVPVPAQT